MLYEVITVGCTGGGSNFAGLAFPFIGAQLRGGKIEARGRRVGVLLSGGNVDLAS